MTYKKKDKIGKVFSRLTVIESLDERTKDKHVLWLCRCECGTIRKVSTSSLVSGNTKSCGCYHRDEVAARNRIRCKTHGMSWHPRYKCYTSMLDRCRPGKKYSFNYYDRGIRVCARWQGIDGFRNYLEDTGDRPSTEYSLDRINNDGHYEPGNVRWATRIEQLKNQRKRARIDLFTDQELISELQRRGLTCP